MALATAPASLPSQDRIPQRHIITDANARIQGFAPQGKTNPRAIRFKVNKPSCLLFVLLLVLVALERPLASFLFDGTQDLRSGGQKFLAACMDKLLEQQPPTGEF